MLLVRVHINVVGARRHFALQFVLHFFHNRRRLPLNRGPIRLQFQINRPKRRLNSRTILMPLNHIKLQIRQPLQLRTIIPALLKVSGLLPDKQIEVVEHFARVEAQPLE